MEIGKIFSSMAFDAEMFIKTTTGAVLIRQTAFRKTHPYAEYSILATGAHAQQTQAAHGVCAWPVSIHRHRSGRARLNA
ncbi:hypothetical protein [Roseobacter litoralis]|uniref:hypothetical protein n=1 Tax=Roseobacter litoralis TaxID=42443 RepID=UPI002494B7A6|nr:hypothetical protein [Roseobacter litoralis]